MATSTSANLSLVQAAKYLTQNHLTTWNIYLPRSIAFHPLALDDDVKSPMQTNVVSNRTPNNSTGIQIIPLRLET